MTSNEIEPGGRSGGADIFRIARMFRSETALTRADIVRGTGLSRATANQRLEELISAGLVIAVEAGTSTGGRPAGLFAFNRDRGVLLVADIGATRVRVALCDLGGTVLTEIDDEIEIGAGPEPVLTKVSTHFDELLRRTRRSRHEVMGIGLDVPGPVDFDSGRVISPPIMTGWDRYDIRGWFAPTFDCPVVVENDVNAMAVGEHRFSFPDTAHMVMLKVGTGVGGGIIAAGQVLRGADGAAGDIGHIHLTLPEGPAEEPLCRCGNYGCVEAYAGGWAMARDLRAAGKDVESVDDVLKCLRSGDTDAQQLLRRAGRILGLAVADAVNLLNPRVIAVCGQFVSTDEHLLAGIREVVYQRSLPLATRSLQIVRSRLDTRAGLLGLSILLSEEIFSLDRMSSFLSPAG
jgi:predicted NBD/HSP70 family sugar kinase